MSAVFLNKFWGVVIPFIIFCLHVDLYGQQYMDVEFRLVSITPDIQCDNDSPFCAADTLGGGSTSNLPDPRWLFKAGYDGNIMTSDFVINSGNYNNPCNVAIPIGQIFAVLNCVPSSTNEVNIEVDAWEEDCCGLETTYDDNCSGGGADDDFDTNETFDINSLLANPEGVFTAYTFDGPDAGGDGNNDPDYVFTVEIKWETFQPEISGSIFFCPNGSSQLDAGVYSGSDTYIWSSGETTQTIAANMTGAYTVTVTSNGCSEESDPFSVVESDLAVSIFISSQVSCFGANDGSANSVASGGVPPYTYLWDNGESTAFASNLHGGINTLTVTDAINCTAEKITNIIEPSAALAANASITQPITCNGMTNAAIEVTASGGTTPYSYLWSSGFTVSMITGLPAGTNLVTVTDANGCNSTSSVTIIEPPVFSASTNLINHVQCNGTNDGSASASASGGVTPYTYTWSNGESSSTATNLGPGNQFVTVTDNNGCFQSYTIFITTPPPLNTTLSTTGTILCNGDNTVSISTTASGGTPPFSYLWNTGVTDSQILNTSAGSYSVSITDNNGCTNLESTTINEPTQLSSSAIVISDVSCNGANDGSAATTPIGGTAPYTFIWDDGTSTNQSNILSGGNHNITITDNNGCTTISTVNIDEPSVFSASTTEVSGVLCNGESNGVATANPVGGISPYTYNWDNGENTMQATGLDSGIHFVTVTDDNGCTSIPSVNITEVDGIVLSSSGIVNVTCNGFNNGGATASAIGGSPPYTFSWDNGEFGSSANSLDAGTHFVSTTDTNGCLSVLEVMIMEPPQMNVNVTAPEVIGGWEISCFGQSDGEATATVTGGVPPYTYLWNDPGNQTGITAQGLVAGTYNVSVTDANNCLTTQAITLQGPAELSTFSIDSTSFNGWAVSCNGLSDGEASIVPQGGTPPYQYSWNDPVNQISQIAVGLAAGTYTVEVKDQNDCSFTNTITIHEPPQLTVNPTADGSCVDAIGQVFGNPSGGTGNYVFHQWTCDNQILNSPNTELSTFISSNPGTFNLCYTVRDNNGCEATSSISVQIDDFPAFNLVESASQVCANEHGVGFQLEQEDNVNYAWSTSPAVPRLTGMESSCASIDFSENPGTVFVNAVAENLFGCSAAMSFPVEVLSTLAPDTSKIVMFELSNTFVCLNNTFESYQWGYDEEPSLCPVTLDGEVYADYIAGNTLDLENRYYWVITSDGGCQTKSYFNRPGRSGTIVGVVAPEELAVGIVPNPNEGNFSIKLEGIDEGDYETKIMDALGRSVYQSRITKDAPIQEFPQNFRGLKSGMYFLWLTGEDKETHISKIIIH